MALCAQVSPKIYTIYVFFMSRGVSLVVRCGGMVCRWWCVVVCRGVSLMDRWCIVDGS